MSVAQGGGGGTGWWVGPTRQWLKGRGRRPVGSARLQTGQPVRRCGGGKRPPTAQAAGGAGGAGGKATANGDDERLGDGDEWRTNSGWA
uniref:Uncharacterized protein n=1 Tax=Oryza sativa subsp. japonica TaxID=39947 RepID=Q6YS15_ORYSJ|nr:hypothetical protein [Oryza sativa Japonica Group]